MIIDWLGKIGYGDIISPICYAYNQADRLKENVILNFYFEHSKGTKFKSRDAETINDRIDYIVKNTIPSEYTVTVNQIYDTKIDYNHTNYDDYPLSYHNLRYSSNAWDGVKDHVAVVSSLKNKKKFSQYAPRKAWKDPLVNDWHKYVENLQRLHEVQMVDYETPVEEASKIISSAKLVIGYHGSAMWLARWLGAPMLIYSDREFTRQIFPWCVHNIQNVNVDEIRKTSLSAKSVVDKELKRYLNDLHWTR